SAPASSTAIAHRRAPRLATADWLPEMHRTARIHQAIGHWVARRSRCVLADAARSPLKIPSHVLDGQICRSFGQICWLNEIVANVAKIYSFSSRKRGER